VRWLLSLAVELAHAPETLRRARTLVGDLGRLPAQLERLTETLERTTGGLEHSLGQFADAVGGGMQERLEHLDVVVSDLGSTLSALIGAIPGARRALQSAARSPRQL